MEETKQKIQTAYLVGISLQGANGEESLEELERLAETAGMVVIGKGFQKIREITPATLLGSGKVEEIKDAVQALNADIIVVDTELTGSQVNNLEDVIGIKVIDRITLILDIFAGRAKSNEGKVQVELAQLKYNLPRLSSIQGSSGRFGASGVGMRGPGETKLETDKRAVRMRIEKLEKLVQKMKAERELSRKNRNNGGKYKVAILGYTNVGKSTFINALAKENIYADDKLFATLDTTSRNIYLSSNCQIILTDTVGFISNLPHALIDAFSSTLEEAQNADLILHLIDISNSSYLQQKSIVEKEIEKLNIICPVINVYNKIDKLAKPVEIKNNECVISAKNKTGFDALKNLIISNLTSK